MKILFALSIILQLYPTPKDLETQVINDIFMGLIGTEGYLEPLPIPPYEPIHPDSVIAEEMNDDPMIIEFDGSYDTIRSDDQEWRKQEIEEYENFDWENYYKELAEFKYKLNHRKMDSSRLVLLVKDTLIKVERTQLLNSILTVKGFKRNFEVDTSWRHLAIELVDSVKETKKLELTDITKTGRYELENSRGYQKKENDRIIGYMTFSRIAFNRGQNKACLYYAFVCGGECGEGAMVFVEKINGHWMIIGTRQLWVA